MVRHTPLLKEYLPITKSSQQRYAWVYKLQIVKASQYDWFLLTNCDIRNQHMVTARNKFDTLQEASETYSEW